MRSAINIALLVCCIVIIPFLGLFTTVGIYLCIHMFILGVRPVSLIAGVTIMSVLVMYSFFGLLLGVQYSGALFI